MGCWSYTRTLNDFVRSFSRTALIQCQPSPCIYSEKVELYVASQLINTLASRALERCVDAINSSNISHIVADAARNTYTYRNRTITRGGIACLATSYNNRNSLCRRSTNCELLAHKHAHMYNHVNFWTPVRRGYWKAVLWNKELHLLKQLKRNQIKVWSDLPWWRPARSGEWCLPSPAFPW